LTSFKRGTFVELRDVTGADLSTITNHKVSYKVLIGEIVDIERSRVLILFRSIDRCAWFDKDMDIRPLSTAAKVLYGS